MAPGGALTGAPHEYVVPAGTTVAPPFTGEMVNVPPLQIVAAWLGIDGLGLTVTIIVKVEPGQLPPTTGVTV